MRRLCLLVVPALLAAGCMSNDPQPSTFPQQPAYQAGPPGGGMDPQSQYNQPQYGAPQPELQGVDPNTDVNAEAQSPETDPSQGMGMDPNQDQAQQEPSGDP